MFIKSSVLTTLGVAAIVGVVDAFFKVPCSLPIVQESVDPILDPGVVSQHLHTVHGGNKFSMNQTYTTLRESSCTSCEVEQDLSNYWVPTLYFKDPNNGTFTKVPNGGLLVYYENRGQADVSNGGSGLVAPPAGFRMISGNAAKRSQIYPPGQGSQGELAERALIGMCLRYTTSNPTYSYYGFPTTDCEAGFNVRLQMPSCWDGVNLWLPNNAHVSYLSDLDNGDCDSAHPVTIIHIFYEVTWDITDFASQWVPQGYSWPFVWSTGDPTGWSYHGDFYNGWDVPTLQNAINGCNDFNNPGQAGGEASACPYLTVNSATVAAECKIANVEVVEPNGIQGPLKALPGCNPLQYGPCDATLYPHGYTPCPTSVPACTTTPTAPSSTTAALPTVTGSYVGCYVDSGSARTLNGYTFTSNTMTNSLCQETCAGQGFQYAGTEYSNECYCDNVIHGSLESNSGYCNGPCAGETSTICGGTYALSIYQT